MGRKSPGENKPHGPVGSQGTQRLPFQANPIMHHFHGDPRVRRLRQRPDMAAGNGNLGRRPPDGDGKGFEPFKEVIRLIGDPSGHISQLGAEDIGDPGEEADGPTQDAGGHGKMRLHQVWPPGEGLA